MGESESHKYYWWECKLAQLFTLWKMRGFFKELDMQLQYNPTTILQSIYARETKTCSHQKIWIQMFREVLFITAKTRNNSDVLE